jgi:hypothetical protein
MLENAERVLTAVRAFGFPTPELDAHAMIDPLRILQMGVEPVQIHVRSAISGVTGKRPGWAARRDCGGHEVAFLGREAFLQNKRSSARPKALADIDALDPRRSSPRFEALTNRSGLPSVTTS